MRHRVQMKRHEALPARRAEKMEGEGGPADSPRLRRQGHHVSIVKACRSYRAFFITQGLSGLVKGASYCRALQLPLRCRHQGRSWRGWLAAGSCMPHVRRVLARGARGLRGSACFLRRRGG